MNKNLFHRLPKLLVNSKNLRSNFSRFALRYCFSQQSPSTHRFSYGQGGEFTFNLQNRTYSLSFETIWQDYGQLSYSGLHGQKSFFITEKGKDVNMDDIDLEKNQKEYIKMHCKIPEDYTIKGKINGSIHHLKNSVSSKTRSNPFDIEILGYKNTYQWLSLETEDIKITNKNGEVNIGSLTAKDAVINCESFRSKKVLYSGKVSLQGSKSIDIRSVVAYQDALTEIENSGDVYIESLSGKIALTNTKSLKIDRLLSCKDGIEILCEKINGHIVIQSGTGSIQCLKQPKEVLKQKIKLGKMHKGRLDFDIENDSNPAYSKVLVY